MEIQESGNLENTFGKMGFGKNGFQENVIRDSGSLPMSDNDKAIFIILYVYKYILEMFLKYRQSEKTVEFT